jgi:D-ribose pyranose/furanose isomerase RbsD
MIFSLTILTINVQLFLEMLLLEIRGKTISIASYIKQIKKQRFRDLQEEIATLEKNVTENSIENLETKKHELEFCCSPFRIIVSC